MDENDKVRILDRESPYYGRTGTIVAKFKNGKFLVNFVIWPDTKISPSENTVFTRDKLEVKSCMK